MNKHQLCDQIIEKMEWWRHGSWAEHIDMRTKDEVITVMQNVVDGIASNRQTYKKEVHPAADVQPVKHGKWMYCSIEDMFHCTRCDAAAVRNSFVYCPICGAKMDGDNNG